MPDIYIVTKGCYSDYRIVAAFTDLGAAERFTAAYNSGKSLYDDDAGVETFKEGPTGKLFVWNAVMNVGDPSAFATPEESGAVKVSLDFDEEHGPRQREIKKVMSRTYEQMPYRWTDSKQRVKVTQYWTFIEAETNEEARKIAAEVIQQYRAQEEKHV